VAEYWLRPVTLSVQQTATALFLLGLSSALQWPVSFYTGGLAGLQRQVLLNALLAVFSTVRAVGAVFVLMLIAPTIEAFLWWQVCVSAVQSIVYAGFTWEALPKSGRSARFSPSGLRQLFGFAIGVTGITVVSFLLTQTDRLILAKIMPLDDFGVYAFAASVAFALGRLVQPIFTAVYPRYNQLVAAGDESALVGFYHRTNQVMSTAVLPIAAVVATFAQDLVWLWTGDLALSAASAPIVALLVVGTALNGLMHLPFAMQLAHGWTSLSFRINAISVLLVVPAIWILGREYGGIGAASVWLALNVGYLVVNIPLMHHRLLSREMSRWYWADVAPPLAACTFTVLTWRISVPKVPDGLWGWMLLLVVMVTTIAASLAVTSFPRSVLLAWWMRPRGIASD
jgi:O-antigen/teichoic acid export membrane protein